MTIVNPYAITPEWKAVGLQFQARFANATKSGLNGLKTVGSPVVSDGMRLDGSTQYGYFDAPRFYAAPGFTIELKEVLNFEFSDSTEHYIFDSTPTLGLTVIKGAANTLELRINGTQIFVSAAFGAYWLTNQENSMIISASSGDTTVYFNGTKVIDSDATAFGNFNITKFTFGAKEDGTVKAPINFKSFRYFNKALTDADCEKLYDGRLFDELRPEKATLFAGLRSSYVNGAGEEVTPILVDGETQEMLLGSDGKTAGEKPTMFLPRGGRFDGGDWFAALDRPGFALSVPGAGDNALSINFSYQSGDVSVTAGILSKATASNIGEIAVYQVAGVLKVLFIDQTNGAFIARVSSSLVFGKLENWTITKKDTALSSGINIYRNGILNNGAATSSGTYAQMRNTAIPIRIGKYAAAMIPAGSTVRLVQIPKVGVELSSAQARIWNVRARHLKNV